VAQAGVPPRALRADDLAAAAISAGVGSPAAAGEATGCTAAAAASCATGVALAALPPQPRFTGEGVTATGADGAAGAGE
jgi:hypothetical protein